jgi:hypothetical protein
LKRTLLFIVAILGACWLTWPWPKVVNLFEYIKLKPPVYEETYMSEADGEQYVIDQLRRNGDRPVFKARARYLIFVSANGVAAGRFKRPSESSWSVLSTSMLAELAQGVPRFDGTESLSELIGGEVDFKKEHIYTTNWNALDSTTDPTPLYP